MSRHFKKEYSIWNTDWIDYLFGAIGAASMVYMFFLFAGA